MAWSGQVFGFTDFFAGVQDPRIQRTKLHELIDILFISVAATIAGAEGPTDIVEFARQQLAWCRKFVPLKNGVPSHDTVGRVLAMLKPDQFQAAFLDWIGKEKTGQVLRPLFALLMTTLKVNDSGRSSVGRTETSRCCRF